MFARRLTFSCNPARIESLVLAAVPSDIRAARYPIKSEAIQCEILWSYVAFSVPSL
jgi:hypothetical protein